MADLKTDVITDGGFYSPAFVSSSGSVLIDRMLTQYGGIPSGSIVQYMSKNEGSFKTALSLLGLVEIQKLGHPVGFVDAEHALEKQWAEDIGIDWSPGMFFYSRPSGGEKGLQQICDMITIHGCKGVVVDSVDALVPTKIMESEFGDASIGQHAKLITQGIRRIHALASDNDATVFFINQMKVNMTPMGARGHMQTGGKGINFYSKLIIELDRAEGKSALMGKDTVELRASINKSKFGPSFRTVTTYALQGRSIDQLQELAVLAQELGVVKRKGAWWKTADDQTIGQGPEAIAGWVAEHKDKLITAIRDGDITDL